MMMTTMIPKPSNDEHIKLMIANGGALCHTLVAYRNIVDRFFGVEARYVYIVYVLDCIECLSFLAADIFSYSAVCQWIQWIQCKIHSVETYMYTILESFCDSTKFNSTYRHIRVFLAFVLVECWLFHIAFVSQATTTWVVSRTLTHIIHQTHMWDSDILWLCLCVCAEFHFGPNERSACDFSLSSSEKFVDLMSNIPSFDSKI